MLVIGCGRGDESEQMRRLAADLTVDLAGRASVRLSTLLSGAEPNRVAKAKCRETVQEVSLWPLLSVFPGVSLIVGAGGVPVLAHPLTLDLSPSALRAFVAELRDAGLQGVEAYYPEHAPRQQAQYLALAEELDLVATGGSDFHGELNPDISLGKGFGSLHVPDDVVEALHARRP